KAFGVERVADRADPPVHHVGGRDDVGAGARLVQGLAHEGLDRLVIENANLASRALADEAVVTVARIRIEGDVGDQAELREFALDCAAGPADEIAFAKGLAAALVL